MTVFEALADETRRRLLLELADGAQSAGELAATEAVSRPAISRHLKVLRQAGLLDVRQHGRHRIYALRPDGLSPVRELLDRLEAVDEPIIALPVTDGQLAALDLEVRRTARESRTMSDHLSQRSSS
ncbi:metalloregulator ArsR/SmtB family transcription factor [Georgenia satyanarayanai]|uniref:ArsR/SmtB family transcription factor n=1 Tax=Georgenia satyanarayanai TaxID=860221 RepID=UPI00203E2DA8|nr:metalloregulator ArsR/SmtB family transcription factor [Georgenia satyanarayanai]MCM3662370.1 metalloregulator ArsR/SmtB family transcription factor [Georgenia satyanarayanai]